MSSSSARFPEFWARIGRRKETRAIALTVLAYGASQVLIATAAIVRIPLLVSELGAPAFGVFMVILGLWPWFNACWDAIRQATRVRALDELGRGNAPHSAVASMSRVTTRWALITLAVSVALAVSPVLTHMGSRASVSADETRGACVLLGLVAAAGIKIAPRAGLLEAEGRTVVVNLAASLVAVPGLPLLLLALALDAPFYALVGVTLGAYLLPFALLGSVGSSESRARGRRTEDERESASVVRKMSIWTFSGVLGSGLDTLAVALLMGPTTAGVYAVVQRLMAFALLIPTALGGYITRRFARLRYQSDPEEVSLDVVRAMLGYLLVGGLVALTFFEFAPVCVDVLTRGALTAPSSLYLAMSGVILTQYASSPLLASLTSGHGLTVRNRIVVVASVVNVGLTFLLTSTVGTAGPAIATAVAGFVTLAVVGALLRTRPVQLFAP